MIIYLSIVPVNEAVFARVRNEESNLVSNLVVTFAYDAGSNWVF